LFLGAIWLRLFFVYARSTVMGRHRQMRYRRYAAVVLAAVAATVLVADGFAAPASRSSVPAPLVGTCGKTVTLATWQKNGVFSEQAGHWAIVISKRGKTSLFTPPGKPMGYPALTTMPVTGSGRSVVFSGTADGACPARGSYTWKVSGRTLTFKLVKDHCPPRQVLLTAGAWTRA
jgi:hypothetical protein